MHAGLRRPDGKLLERLLERNTPGSHAKPARGAGQHATGAGRFGADAVIADAVVGFLIVLVATVTAAADAERSAPRHSQTQDGCGPVTI